ncbi:MAG: hypothetical protein ACHQXA_09505, partial [Gemmatimonadales bacterium]
TSALGSYGGWNAGRRCAEAQGRSPWGEQRGGFGWVEQDFGSAPPLRPSTPAPLRPSVPAESDDTPRYVKGERVKHRKFGSGVIQGLSGGGRELKVTVQFDDTETGIKQLLVAYAGLERDRDWESA